MKLGEHIQRRILVADANDHYRDAIADRLKDIGYDVAVARSLDECLNAVESRDVHFFACDISLERPHLPDQVPLGVQVRNAVMEQWPQESSQCVLLLAKDENDAAKWATVLTDNFCIFTSELDETVAKIDERFRALTPHNWGLEIEDVKVASMLESEKSKISASALAEILLLLFPSGENRPTNGVINVEPLSEQGYTDAALFTVNSPSNTGRPSTYVVKVGPPDEIENEVNKYYDFVECYDIPDRVVLLSWAKSQEFHEAPLAGIKYATVVGSRQARECYFDAKTEEQAKELGNAIRTLLQNVLHDAWYMQAAVRKGEIPRRLIFSDVSDEWLRERFIACFSSTLAAGNVDSDRLNVKLSDGHIECINLLRIFPQLDDSKGDIALSLVHGDLHTANILVRSRPTQAITPIDYANAARDQPIYRDFAKLEFDVFTELIQHADLFSVHGCNILCDLLRYWLCKDQNKIHFEYEPRRPSPLEHHLASVVISEVRAALHNTLESIHGRDNAHKMQTQHRRSYIHALLRECINAWKWLDQLDEEAKLINLMYCSVLVEACEGGDFEGATKVSDSEM